MPFTNVEWVNDRLMILDQTQLPNVAEYVELKNQEEVWSAIRNLLVRGADAIGVVTAYGLYLGIRDSKAQSYTEFLAEFERLAAYLSTSRPTAVHMFWVIERVTELVRGMPDTHIPHIKEQILNQAIFIHRDNIERCRAIGEHGLSILHDGARILTHCNAGALATNFGTALAPVYIAQEKGWNIKVWADETRPVLQGARLTVWELMDAGVDVTLICDNMAAVIMNKGWVDAVIIGADRIAANGDTANKIGSYGLAVLAKEHGIPFYVAAPTSTIDLRTMRGEDIVIEERPEEEITEGLGKRIAPAGAKVYNPAFDVTPARYITGIITENGIIHAPNQENIRRDEN